MGNTESMEKAGNVGNMGNMGNMGYAYIYNRLNYELGVITFFKKNGDIRIMLGTRNMNTISIKYGFQGKALGGHDNRCNISNGNIAVFDMVIGEARSFSVDRLCGEIHWFGEVTTEDEYNKVFEQYIEYKERYEECQKQSIDLDSIGDMGSVGNMGALGNTEDTGNINVGA